MNDAQTWTAIGGLLAVLMGFLGLMIRLFTMAMDGRIGALEAKVEAGFARLDRRMEGLDRDVNALSRRLMEGP